MSPDEFWFSQAINQRAGRLRRRAFVRRSLLLPAVAATVYVAVLGIGVQMGVGPRTLIVDSANTALRGPASGLISNLGILLWTTASAICLFAVLSSSIDNRRNTQLIALGGLLSATLAVDGLFRIHDAILPQSVCYGVYAASACLILVSYRREIFQLGSAYLLLAGAYLALSILIDLAQNQLPFENGVIQIFEEGFKFVGIVTWCVFWISAVLKSRSDGGRRFVRLHISNG